MIDPFGIAVAPLLAFWLVAGWLDVVGPLIAILFLVLQQVLSGKVRETVEEEGEGRPGRPLPQDDEEEEGLGPRQTVPPRPEGRPAAAGQADLRSEVEEFLRRLGEPEADPAKAAAERSPEPPGFDEPERRRGAIDPFEEPPKRNRPRPTERKPQIEVLVEPPSAPSPPPTVPVAAAPEPPQRADIGTLRERHRAHEAAHELSDIAQSDERLEARLHEKFDHRLGNLGSRASSDSQEPAAAAVPTTASRIKTMLAQPGGVRDAVILSEILNRPADRF